MKVLKVAVIVIGVAALAATGIGLALGGAAGTGTFLGASAATWTTIGAVAGVAGGALGIGVSLLATRPSFSTEGSPVAFQTNPQSGLPYPIGRTRNSGLKIDGKTAASTLTSATHDLLFLAAMLSCTPAYAIESFTADNVTIAFDGSTGAATTTDYVGWMAQKVNLGQLPQTTALSLSLKSTAYPGWTSAHKLSGKPHVLWALTYDPDGKHFSGGLPEPAWVGKWALVYDPRKDSTYPGGSGSHRALNEATYEWSRNPGLHALTWCLGRWANGKKVCGIGAPVASIRVADFVEMANVCDVNGWGIGGVEYSGGPKLDVLKRMLQAGGAVYTKSGAMIGCRVRTPRVSIGTITAADLLGPLDYPAMKPQRDRINTVLPRYRSEAHGWEVITGTAISVSAYVTADGRRKTEGIDYPLVQSESGQTGFNGELHVGQLAAYDICDSREAGPITLTVGPKWIGLRAGDCITLDIPDEDISMVKVVLTAPPRFDPATGQIGLTAETETDSKHAFALGTSTTPPAAPTLTTPAPAPAVPSPADWTVTPIALADGQAGLRLSGTITDLVADSVLVDISVHGAATWKAQPTLTGAGPLKLDIGPLDSATSWDVRLAYSAKGRPGDYLEISATDTGASAILDRLAASTRRGTAFPAASDSAEGQLFIRTDLGGRYFLRQPGDGIYAIGGTDYTIGGVSYYLPPWIEVTDDRMLLALATADAALDQLIAIADDDVLSMGEKPQVVREWGAVNENWSALDAKATALGGVSGTIQADAASAVSALYAYLTGLTPSWTDYASDTVIVSGTFAGKWSDAYTKVAALQAAIQGLPGSDGISPVAFDIAPQGVTLQLYANGAIKPDQLPIDFVVTARQGGGGVALTSLSIDHEEGGDFTEDDIVITLENLTSGASTASVQFTGVAGGQTVSGLSITVNTTKDGAAPTGHSVSVTPTTTEANSTTPAQIGSTLDVAANASGGLSVNLTGGVKPDGADYQFQSKAMYAVSPFSSYTDVSGSSHDSTISDVAEVGGDGSGVFKVSRADVNGSGPYAMTSLGAGTIVRFKIVFNKKSGAASLGALTGGLTLYVDNA